MRLLPFALVFFCSVAVAQQAPPPPSLEPVPDGPPDALSEDGLVQPEVTIRRRADDTIREYRVNGRVYMIQVIPQKGVPYFLVDTDGDGSLETRYNDLDSGIMVPGWVIFSW